MKKKTVGEILKEEGIIKENEEKAEPPKKEEVREAEIILKIEKLAGKVELQKDMINKFNDRFSSISETVGDLRRMIIDKEKFFDKLSADFEKLKSEVEEVEPQKIAKNFKKFAVNFEKTNAELEKINFKIKTLSNAFKKAEEKLSKIKEPEVIAKLIENASKIESNVRESRNYVDRLAGKIEALFSEFTSSLNEIKKEKEIIYKDDELIKEVVKDLDKINVKLENEYTKKNEFEDFANRLKRDADNFLKEKFEMVNFEKKSLEELENEKDKIKEILNRVEMEYNKGSLSKSSYEEIVKTNKKRLSQIESILKKFTRDLLYADLKNVEKRVEKISSQLQSLPKTEEIAEIRRKFMKLENGFSSLDGISGLKERLEYIEMLKDSLIEQEKRLTKMREMLNELMSTKELVKSLRREREDIEQKIRNERSSLSVVKRDMLRIERTVRELGNKMIETEDEIRNIVKTGKLTLEFRNLRDKVKNLSEETKETREEISEIRKEFDEALTRNLLLIKKLISKK